MLSVITALEFFRHHFAKMGHRNTSCDPHLHQAIEQPNVPYLTRSVRRRAATSIRRNRSSGNRSKITCMVIRTNRELAKRWAVVSEDEAFVSSDSEPPAAYDLSGYLRS
jgi:hypothetical protein